MPNHPAYKTIFQSKYSERFADKPSAIPTFGIRINNLFKHIPTIELSEPDSPVWTINQPVIRLDLHRLAFLPDGHWESKTRSPLIT